MITLYTGDSHGQFVKLHKTITKALAAFGAPVDQIVSVGDFGYWPKQGYQFNNPHGAPVFFVDGNHEDHHALATDTLPNIMWKVSYIPRGTIRDGVFYCGGATSIDKQYRIAGQDWFEEENISQRQFHEMMDSLKHITTRIQVMCCHDTVVDNYKILLGNKIGQRNDPNATALQYLWRTIRPRLYVHGHHHCYNVSEVEGTTFVSLAMTGPRSNPPEKCCVVADHEGNILWPTRP